VIVAFSVEMSAGQQTPPKIKPAPTYVPPVLAKEPSPVEKLGKGLLRVGNVRIDTNAKEVSVNGVVNDVKTLEFLANSPKGFKAYESAIELATNALNFNLGLILIGLDAARAKLPKMHLDPNPPAGDPVEVWVSWDEAGKARRVRAEELVYNEVTKVTLSAGWVYTGSRILPNGQYLADLDGTLIGFVHSPSPVIESAAPLMKGPYGANRFNTSLGLQPGTAVVMTVKALDRPVKR
jgi:hypothetical protein